MATSISRATCMAAFLTLTWAGQVSVAQTTTVPPKTSASPAQKAAQGDKNRAPTPPATGSVRTTTPREATLSGCVVRDAVNAGQATITSNGISYKLTGRTADDLNQYLGKRVEVTGIMTAATDTRATTGTIRPKAEDATPPKGLTATGGQSDVTSTGVPRDNTVATVSTVSTVSGAPSADTPQAIPPATSVPLATDRGTTADLTGQMNVKTVRVISPNCL
jgi:hypothetical protein